MPGEARVDDLHRAGIRTGSESFIFGARTWKCLVLSKSELNNAICSATYKAYPGLVGLIAVLTSESDCPSLYKRRLPRLTPPGEPLRQRIDLIVMAARE